MTQQRSQGTTTQFELTTSEGTYTVDARKVADGFEVTLEGKTFFVKLERTGNPGTVVAELDGTPLNVSLHALTSQNAEFSVQGERLSYHRPLAPVGPTPERLVETKISGDILASPMPGRVITLMATVGSQVKAGDPLILIESMKMETVVRSDREGEVQEVLVTEGAPVKRGQALVRFRPGALS